MVTIEDLEKEGVKIQTWIDHNSNAKYFKMSYFEGRKWYTVGGFDTPEAREGAVNEMKRLIDGGNNG